MAEIDYLDFDLSIERVGDQDYRARVLESPGGQAAKEFKLPFSDLELENFVLKVGRAHRGTRRLESPEMELAKTFGGNLFRAVFSNEVYSCLRSSLEKAEEQGRGLRVRLRLNDAPELVDLPWEYLYNPGLNRFLSLSINTPLVRYLELPERISPLAVELPLRILVMIASPEDYPSLDVEKEWENLQNALGDLERKGAVILERLSSSTPVALQYRLRRKDYHIFHFVGHGAFDEGAQDGVLVMEDEKKRGRLLSGQYLGTLLHDEKTLRMAVLNACEGARTGRTDPFAGAAQSLVQQGIPAVVAMQFEVLDQAAISFAREFYAAIADAYPVDAALNEARKVMFSTGLDTEWGAPVLYMRSPDGQIFDIKQILGLRTTQTEELPALDPQLEQKLEQLYMDGLSAYWLKDWRKAITNFDAYLARKPGAQDVVAKLEEAKRQLDWLELDEQAQEASQEKDWARAVGVLEKLVDQAPSYENAKERLEEAREQAQLADLYQQAKQLYDAGQWQAVVNIFDQIDKIEPGYPDEGGILAAARDAIKAQESETELNHLYRSALEAMDNQQWGEAKQLLEQVRGIDPGYRDSEPLSKVVEDSLARIDAEEEASRSAKKAAERQAKTERRKEEEAAAQTAEREKALSQKYQQALRAINQKDWSQAEAYLLEIAAADPNYGDVQQLLEGDVQQLLEQARNRQAQEADQEAAARHPGVQERVSKTTNVKPLFTLLQGNWILLVGSGLIWGVAFSIINFPFLSYYEVSDPDIYTFIGGAAGGFFLWLWYRQTGLNLSLLKMSVMVLIWGFTSTTVFSLLTYSDSIMDLILVGTLFGLIGGLGTWLVISVPGGRFELQKVFKHGLIWMGSWLAGLLYYALLADKLLLVHEISEGMILAFSSGILIGALGGLFSLQQIHHGLIATSEAAEVIESEAAPVQAGTARKLWPGTTRFSLVWGAIFFSLFLGIFSAGIGTVEIAGLVYLLFIGGLGGLLTYLALRKEVTIGSRAQLGLLIFGWGISIMIAFMRFDWWGMDAYSTQILSLGLIGGLATSFAITTEKKARHLGIFILLPLIWILGWTAGFLFYDFSIQNGLDLNNFISTGIVTIITGMLVGAIGGAGTLWAISRSTAPAKAQ